jgi:hypothetical protein
MNAYWSVSSDAADENHGWGEYFFVANLGLYAKAGCFMNVRCVADGE